MPDNATDIRNVSARPIPGATDVIEDEALLASLPAVTAAREAGAKGDPMSARSYEPIIDRVRRRKRNKQTIVVFDSGEKWVLNEETGKVRRTQPPPEVGVDLPVSSAHDAEQLSMRAGRRSAARNTFERNDHWEIESSEGTWLVDKATGSVEHLRS